MAVHPWQWMRRDLSRRMASSKTFEDYPGTESGDIHDAPPPGYGGRKPFSPIAEEEEELSEENLRRLRGTEDVAGGMANSHRSTPPRSSTSPKHVSLSPSSSSGHSSPRSPPTYPPPPPSTLPPPLPPGQNRSGHAVHQSSPNSGSRMKKGGSSRQPQDRKPTYDGHQYPGYPTDGSYMGKGMAPSKPHPQSYGPSSPQGYPSKGQVGDKSYSGKQIPMSGLTSGHSAEVVTKIVATKQYAMSFTDHLGGGDMGMVDTSRGDHVMSGDPGVRECPSGASSPSSTPNNTLVKGSKVHYDPLASSSSESRLIGGTRGHQNQPLTGDSLNSHSDSNLLGYHSYPGGVASNGGHGESDVGGGVRGAHVVVGPKPPPVARSMARKQQEAGKGVGPGGPPRVNGHSMEGQGTNEVNEGSEEPPPPGKRPPSNDSGYVPSSSSASLQSNITPSTEPEQHSEGSDPALSGGVSPSSSSEELAKINDGSGDDVTDAGGTPTHPILKPEPTKSSPSSSSKPHPPTSSHQHQKDFTASYPPRSGTYATTNQIPSSSSHVGGGHQMGYSSGGVSDLPYAPPTSSSHQHHPFSLSQPGPSQIMSSQQPLSTAQGSHSQGHTYYPNPHQGVMPMEGGSGGRDVAGATTGGSYPSYHRRPYENVPPMSYDGNTRHAHMTHPHPNPHPKYGGMGVGQGGMANPASASGYKQGGGAGADLRGDRSHDMRDRPHDGRGVGGAPKEYPPPVTRPPYGQGPRRKPINTASISIAYDAAGGGDIATLHHMLTNHEIDAFTFNEHKFTLAHKAALHGQVSVLNYLVSDAGLPVTALQLPDESFSTPAMLAIQGGHVECLQWMVEECKVPLEVRDTGGETLMHHAAYHGQVKCLEWLLKILKKRDEQHKELLDECGVSPAHFAAQGGHLDCLQLLIDLNYSVTQADREGQKPLDWADHMNQTVCVRYLMMYEACWALSAEVTHLTEQLAIIHKKYEKVQEMLTTQNEDHKHAMGLMQQNHKERISKMREQYVDFTASILKNSATPSSSSSSTSSSASATSSFSSSVLAASGGGAEGGAGDMTNKKKSQGSSRKQSSHGNDKTQKPPLPPSTGNKKHLGSSRGGGGQGHEGKGEEQHHEMDFRTATPQEVMQEQMSSVHMRMTLRREARKKQGGLIPRNFSPLTPVFQRFKSDEEPSTKMERQDRERQDRERQDRERQDRERQDRERQDRERQDRERQDRERQDRERQDRERQDRERQDRERQDRPGRIQRHSSSESHERRTSAPKAVKFSNTITEYHHYEEDWSSGGVVSKPAPSHKHSPSHSASHSVNHSSPSHSSAHSVGLHTDRNIPDGDSAHGKLKTSTDK